MYPPCPFCGLITSPSTAGAIALDLAKQGRQPPYALRSFIERRGASFPVLRCTCGWSGGLIDLELAG